MCTFNARISEGSTPLVIGKKNIREKEVLISSLDQTLAAVVKPFTRLH